MMKFTNYAVRLGMEVCNKRTGIKDDANISDLGSWKDRTVLTQVQKTIKKGDYVGRLPFYVAFS